MTPQHFIYDVKSTITSNPLYLTSRPLYLCNHTHSQWYHSHTMYITYSIHVTSYPLYLWHHIHYVWQQNTLCCWYHTRHMGDIVSTTFDITFTLSHQTTVFMSHPLHAWNHTHCIRRHTHCIFVITSSPLISYPLLYDIIPLYVWHHMHSI